MTQQGDEGERRPVTGLAAGPAPPPLPPDVEGRATSPAQKLTADFRNFRLLEDADYMWWHPLDRPLERALYRLIVPEGFVHDFASVPRVLWALISPFDLGLASIFHDWLYRRGGQVETLRWDFEVGAWEAVTTPWTRVQSDELFARTMREQGVVKWRRRAAYGAVRGWGGPHWHEPQATEPTPPADERADAAEVDS